MLGPWFTVGEAKAQAELAAHAAFARRSTVPPVYVASLPDPHGTRVWTPRDGGGGGLRVRVWAGTVAEAPPRCKLVWEYCRETVPVVAAPDGGVETDGGVRTQERGRVLKMMKLADRWEANRFAATRLQGDLRKRLREAGFGEAGSARPRSSPSFERSNGAWSASCRCWRTLRGAFAGLFLLAEGNGNVGVGVGVGAGDSDDVVTLEAANGPRIKTRHFVRRHVLHGPIDYSPMGRAS